MKKLSSEIPQNVLNLHFGKNLNTLNQGIMKKMFKTFVVAVIFILGYKNDAYASHVMGADLSYRMIDTTAGTYKFKLTVYRDCAGIQYGGEQLKIVAPGISTTVTMTLVAANVEVTPICLPPDVSTKPTTNCPSGPVGSNGIKGVDKWIFETTYTIGRNKMAYVGWTTCCRNAAITTGPSGNAIWVQAVLNTTYVNNSTIFTTPPIPYWCRQRLSTYNHGAVDSFDPRYVTLSNGKQVIRDSVSYEMIVPFQAEAANPTAAFNKQNTPVSLNTGLTAQNFLYTTSGVTFSPTSGAISCIPSSVQDAVLGMAVNEYRAIPNSTGGYSRQPIGYVCRDLQLTVRDICDPITTPGIITDSLKSAEFVNSTTVDICGAKYTQVSFKLVGAASQTLKSKVLVTPNAASIKNFKYTQVIVRANNVDTLYGTITFDSTVGVGQEKFIVEAFYCTSIGTRVSQFYTLTINFRPSVFVTKSVLYYCTGGRYARATVNGGGTSYSWTPTTGIKAAASDSSWVDLAPLVTTTYIATAKSVQNSTSYCSLVDSVKVINIPKFNYSLSPKTVDLCLHDTFQVSLAAQAADAPYIFTWKDPASGSLFDTATNRRSLSSQNPKGTALISGNYIVDIESKYGCILTDTVKVNVNGVVPNATGLRARGLVCPGDTTLISVSVSPKSCGLTSFNIGNSTVDITHDAGSSSNYPSACASASPSTCYPSPYSAVGGGRSGITRIIYTKTELAAKGMKAGIIRGLSFNISNLVVSTIDQYEIRMACVSNTDATKTVPTYTVYGPTTQSCVGGWNDYTFTKGYDWDGVSNLLVEIRVNSTGAMSSANVVKTFASPGGNAVAYKFSNTSGVTAEDETGGFTPSGVAFTKPHVKFKVSSVDSTSPTSLLTTVWAPAAQVITVGQVSPRAIAKVSQKDSLFTATVGTAQCFDTAVVKVKVDTNFSVKGAGGKVLCKGASNPVVNLTSTIKGTPDSIRWFAISTGNPGMPSNTTTQNITVTPDIGTHKYVITTYDLPCFAVDTVIVTVNNGLTVNFNIDSPVCSTSNGKLTAILPAGGTVADFNFTWKKASTIMAGRTKDTLNNILPDNYTLDIALKSDATCTGTITRNVAPVIIKLNPAISTAGILCNGGNATLTASASATKSPGPYTYTWTTTASWTTIGTGAVQTNKPANTAGQSYRVVVQDNITSCYDTTTYTLTQPSLLTVSITKADVLCNGGATGYLKATAAGGTIGGGSYVYSWTKTASSFTSGLNELFNQTAGTYIVTVTDINGCTATASMTITEPAKLILDSVIARNATTVKGTDGNAIAYVSGGSAPYDYTWNKGTSFLVTNLDKGVRDSIRPSYSSVNKGIYHVTVTDNNGCVVSGNVFVDEPPCKWDIRVTTDSVLCFGASTGVIHVSTLDSFNLLGTTSYTYSLYRNRVSVADTPSSAIVSSITKSQTPYVSTHLTSDHTGLVGGLGNHYMIRIQTSKNCDTIFDQVYIGQNPQLIFRTENVTPSCPNVTDGQVYVRDSGGGVPPYTFDFGSGFAAATFRTDRLPGLDSVIMRDRHNCVEKRYYTVNIPPTITTSAGITDTVRCFGESNGKGDIVITNADVTKVGNYLYDNKPGTTTTNTNNVMDGVPAGTYTINVSYENLAAAKRCTIPTPFTMVEPPQLTLAHTPVNLPCSYSTDGSIKDIDARGGNAGPNFVATISSGSMTRNKSIDSANLTPSMDSFSGLTAGVYTLTVVDRRGCSAVNTPITLTSPPVFSLSLAPISASCITVPDGRVVATETNGSPNYTYQWTRKDELSGAITPVSGSASTVTGLYGLSTYTAIATDANGCVATKSVFVDTVYVLRINEMVSTVAPCFGGNGTMTITSMSPAIQPSYTYSYSDGQNGSGMTSIIAPKGTYTVTVTDMAGCVTTGVQNIDERPEIKILGHLHNPKCYNEPSGSIKIEVSGGTPPFITNKMIWSTTPNQGTDSVTQIKAGNYTVRVSDANNCMKSATFTLVDPKQLLATIDSKKDVTCFAASNGEAEVKVTGGVENFVYVWNKDNASMPLEKKSKISNLGPATYRVTVTDNNSCTATASTTVTEPKRLEYDVLDTQEVSCPHYNDGYINIQAKGGIATNAKQYEYSIDGGQNFVTGGKFPSLKAGDYSVVIRDNNGCVAPRKVTVGTPEELFITATKDRYDSLKMGESTTLGFTKLTQSGMIPSITKMSWSEESGLSCSDCETPKASPYVTTLYTIEARYHKNCIAKSSIKVNVKDPLDFFVPNAFTPGNGDGINDILYVYGNGIKKLRFMIFNRWGEKVFETDHLSKGWDGIYKGELQQSGVYSYSAEVEYLNGDQKNKKGSITLIK